MWCLWDLYATSRIVPYFLSLLKSPKYGITPTRLTAAFSLSPSFKGWVVQLK